MTASASMYPQEERSTHSSSSSLLEIDRTAFRANFGHTPFKIRHSLVGHPLLTLDSLVELSRRLPEHHVKFNSGHIPIGTRLYTAATTGLSAQETIRSIDKAGSWMVLKYVEQDDEYAELMDACLDEVLEFSEALDPGMIRREAYIFITSPNSTTAWHLDPEHSFLLQATGSKTMFVQDNSIMSERDWEAYFNKGTVPPFKEEYRSTAQAHHIKAGEGLHVPVTVPHWVENGPEVSVSFSVTFRTAAVERRAMVYDVNAYLRKRGIDPDPFGKSPRRDVVKAQAFRAVRRVKRAIGDESATHSGKY
jgi:hypothetical protein